MTDQTWPRIRYHRERAPEGLSIKSAEHAEQVGALGPGWFESYTEAHAAPAPTLTGGQVEAPAAEAPKGKGKWWKGASK